MGARKRHNQLSKEMFVSKNDTPKKQPRNSPKKTTNATLYCWEVRFKSSAIPAIFALPMLDARAVRQEQTPLIIECLLGPVHVRQEIHDPHGRHEKHVYLSHHLSLLFRCPVHMGRVCFYMLGGCHSKLILFDVLDMIVAAISKSSLHVL
jgi:hypothetical protein